MDICAMALGIIIGMVEPNRTEKNLTEPSKFFIYRLASVCQVPYEELIDYLYYVKSGDILKLVY
jgi:hypothetical protein